MPKVRTQTCAPIQQCVLGHAHKQNKVHALPKLRYNVLAEESITQGANQFF
jgi:hypothetical protein